MFFIITTRDFIIKYIIRVFIKLGFHSKILTAIQSLVRTILGPAENMKMCLKSSDRRSL